MMGSPLLAALPVLALALLWAILMATWRDGRRAFVVATIAWGAYLALVSEALSLFRALTQPWIALAWLLACLGLAALAWRRASLRAARELARDAAAGLGAGEKVLLGGMALLCAALLAIALIAPPNTYDSALYHMARVMHWAQNASLRPYPALFEHQLHKPIWAETAILHLRVLWGNDRPANLVQWFAMLGSALIVSGAAARVGAGRPAQLLAAAYALSIPMGVLQATSTQNDYVAAYWAIALAYLALPAPEQAAGRGRVLALAGAVGLGALTKGTFFVYGPPFVAWFLLRAWRARGLRQAVTAALAIAGMAALLNLGFWVRNIQVFGGPYGTSEWLQRNLWIRILPEPPPAGGGDDGSVARVEAEGSLEDPAPPQTYSRTYPARLLQTAGRNLTLPTGVLSRPVIAAAASLPAVLGERYAGQLRAAPWNHEDFAGSPLHLLLVPLSLLALLVARRARPGQSLLEYAGVSLLAYALIPIVIGHGPSMYGIRYQLSFFVLWAPVVGAVSGLVLPLRWLRAAAAALLVLALPWVLFNKTRPLIGLPPQRTSVGSILVEDPSTILLPWNPGLRDDYLLSTQAVLDSGCTQVALRASAAFLEYPLWWLLGAPQSGIRIEPYDAAPYLADTVDVSFEPCAVICANCEDETMLRGLSLFGTYDSIKVYLNDS